MPAQGDGAPGDTRVGSTRDGPTTPPHLEPPTGDEAAGSERTGDRAVSPDWKRPLLDRPTVRVGIYAWALVGSLLLIVASGYVVQSLRLVIIPAILALFPAAVLYGPTAWLKRRLPDALAALLVILGTFALLSGVVAVIAPAVANEFDGLAEEAQRGAQQLQRFLEDGPFGFEPVRVDELIGQARERLVSADDVGATVLGYAAAVVEGLTGLIFALVVLFFYLKDGPRIARWCKSLFPRSVQDDVDVIGSQSWRTVGGYIRGQLFVALVDAVFIGLGLFILGVPLALPLAVVVFFGGLFPIVGAFLSGFVAVLVALATGGITTALIVLAIILAVQQLEGNVLAPVVLGRSTKLHPLAVVASLTAGGVLLGVLGAFLAIPIAASVARATGYLRERIPG